MQQKELISVLYDAKIVNEEYLSNPVTTIVNDNRLVEPGACFIAIKGEKFDGHQVIHDVIDKGAQILIVEQLPEDAIHLKATFVVVQSTYRAQAILANQFFNQPSTKLNVVAVTGTNGKTTTTNMISQLLESLQHKTGVIGTMHYKVDKIYYPAVNTTPNALELQKLFNEMVEAQCQDALIEASSHALALGRLWYTDIDCAIFTNLTREHLDFHKSMDNYAYAKSLLFSQLGQKFINGKPRLAILNIDDDYYKVMQQATSAEIVSYSLVSNQATAYASNITEENGITIFDLQYKGEKHRVSLPMRGSYNVSNYLAAFLTLNKFYGYSIEEIIEATTYFKGVEGRMQAIDEGQDFEVVVDFAHTPDALERVLQELVKHKKENQRIISLMGHSGGNRDSGMRQPLGDILFKYSDEIVFTADNPRFEPVEKIVNEMIGTHENEHNPYSIIKDRAVAVEHAISIARPNDIVLLAGKGGEPYQVIGDEKIPYDEVQTVIDAIHRLKTNKGVN
ncbi:UDP-N-acetylmuramoyl-L-alanyl-D-glutamate--2,6-diaminopimelate ligase [Aerococcaceae bacterium WGS1372]